MDARHRVRRSIALLFVIAALAACGSGDDGDTAGGSSSTTTAKGSSSEDGGDTGGFGALAKKGAEAEVRITYESPDSGEFVLSQDPPKQAFISTDGKFINDGERTVVCSGEGDEAQCFEMPAGSGDEQMGSFLGAFAAPFAMIQELDKNAATMSGVETSDDEIAGRDAWCATIDASKLPGSTSTGTSEVCIDKETGVLLRLASDGEVTLEATDIGKPKSDDFEPTKTPQTLPGSGD